MYNTKFVQKPREKETSEEGACTGPLQQPNTRFLAPTRDHNPSGISIGSAVFAGLTARDQQTDTQTTEQQVSK